MLHLSVAASEASGGKPASGSAEEASDSDPVGDDAVGGSKRLQSPRMHSYRSDVTSDGVATLLPIHTPRYVEWSAFSHFQNAEKQILCQNLRSQMFLRPSRRVRMSS